MDTNIKNQPDVKISNGMGDTSKDNWNNNYKVNINATKIAEYSLNSDTISLGHIKSDPTSDLSLNIVNNMINSINENRVKDGDIAENNNVLNNVKELNEECNNNNGKDSETNSDLNVNGTKEGQKDSIANIDNGIISQQKRKRKTSHNVPTLDEFCFRCIHCEKTFSDVDHYKLHLANHKSPAKQNSPKKSSPNKRKNKRVQENNNNEMLHVMNDNVISSILTPASPVIASNVIANRFAQMPSLSQSPLLSLSQSPLFSQQPVPVNQNESNTKPGCPPFKCRVCQKIFSFPCNLKQHFKLHSDQDPFSCECGALFSSAAQFTKHYKKCPVIASNNTPETTQATNVSPIVIKPKSNNSKKSGLKFCIVCGQFCSNQADLDVHMKSHSDENLLNCEKCGKHFINPEDLFQHLNTHFKDRNDMAEKEVHAVQRKVSEELPHTEIAPVYSCDICKITFKSPDDLTNHVSSFHLNQPIKQEKEDFDYHGLARSLVDNHKTKTCDLCNESVHESEMEFHLSKTCINKELHIKTVNSLLNNNNQIGVKIENCLFLCPHCPVSFETEHELLNHIHLDQCNNVLQQDTHISKRKSKIKNEQFTTVNGSPKGKKKGSPKKSPCVIRQKKDSVKTADSADPDDITVLSESRRYKCDLCDESFLHCQELKVHKQEHDGKKCYTCKVCGKRFVKSSAMFYHSKIHTGEEPYKCQFCGKTFRSTSNLKAHENLHTGLKMFKCEICSKEFRSNSNLRTHMKFHSEDKPFKCVFCDKEFAVRYNLKVHLRTHSGDKHYKCPCGKSYSSNEGLKRHTPKCTA